VCVCVCVFVFRDHSFGTASPIFTKFLCVLPMAVARSSSGLGYKQCAVIPVAGQRAHVTTFLALKVTSKVATPGAESAVYGCFIGAARSAAGTLPNLTPKPPTKCHYNHYYTKRWPVSDIERERQLSKAFADEAGMCLASYVGSQHDATAFTSKRVHRVPAIDRYLLQGPALSSKPSARRCCCQSTGQTDGRTEGLPAVT